MSSILLRAYRQGIYLRFPSITSIRSSSLTLLLKQISQFDILYSFNITFTVSSSSSGVSTIRLITMPPFSFFLKSINGGDLLSLIPNPSSSFSIIYLCFTKLKKIYDKKKWWVINDYFKLYQLSCY